MKLSLSLKVKLLSCIAFYLVSPLCTAQNYTSKINISFNSYFEYDSTKFVKSDKSFYLKDNPNTYFAIQFFDHDLEPDSVKLNTHIKQTIEKFEKLKADSAKYDSLCKADNATYELGRIDLDRGFYGFYKKTKITIDSQVMFEMQFDTYQYDDHGFGEFQYKCAFGTDSPDMSDLEHINEFIHGLKTLSMESVREENQKIRDYYKLKIDTLPLENYWIHVYYKDGKMTRDSIFMADLDSNKHKVRFTHYNITYNGMIIMQPGLKHSYQDLYLENLKNLEVKGDTLFIQLRDVQSGMVSKYGYITILNSLDYPIELPFRFSYKNYLYDKLRSRRN